MTGIELLLGGGAIAGKEALKKLVERLYDSTDGPLKNFLKKIQNDRKISQLFTQIAKVRKVKTLGQLDKAVDLMSFYCDSHVQIHGQKKKIVSLTDFPLGENILIEGIAGQGKSIFLRYLCAVELYRGENIPVFVELRKISKTKDLIDLVLFTLETYGFDFTKKQLAGLADSGRLLLLLDAFDEVPEEHKTDVITDIEHLSLKHEKLRILVTSRPDSGLHTCAAFTNVRLSNLQGDEFAVVVNKITNDAELAEQLINQVKRHKGELRGLLQTPLLVTLLVIRYKSYPELPQQMSDFYDSLFQVLLQRHDGSKPGYKRQRRTRLNDMQYRMAFDTLCFLSKRYNGKQLTEKIVLELVAESLSERGYTAEPEDLISDIIKITCLIVKDGEEMRFVHKSIQEFFASSYIQRRPDVVVQQLYKKLFTQKYAWRFHQELLFLRESDRYRYYKFGELEFLHTLLGVEIDAFRKTPSVQCYAKVRLILDEVEVGVSEYHDFLQLDSIQLPSLGPMYWSIRGVFDRTIISNVVAIINSRRDTRNIRQHVIDVGSLRMHRFKLGDWPKSIGQITDIASINLGESAKAITDELFSLGKIALEYVENEESNLAVSKLD